MVWGEGCRSGKGSKSSQGSESCLRGEGGKSDRGGWGYKSSEGGDDGGSGKSDQGSQEKLEETYWALYSTLLRTFVIHSQLLLNVTYFIFVMVIVI